jgi:hypothetical protein
MMERGNCGPNVPFQRFWTRLEFQKNLSVLKNSRTTFSGCFKANIPSQGVLIFQRLIFFLAGHWPSRQMPSSSGGFYTHLRSESLLNMWWIVLASNILQIFVRLHRIQAHLSIAQHFNSTTNAFSRRPARSSRRLEQQLQDVASGSWQFSDDFNAWRDAQK